MKKFILKTVLTAIQVVLKAPKAVAVREGLTDEEIDELLKLIDEALKILKD